MLQREQRLKKDEIREIIARGRGSSSSTTSIRFIHRDGLSVFAFVVSTKVSGSAVMRNKIKRRLRHIIKKYYSNIVSGYCVVIFAQRKAATTLFRELEKDILYLLRSHGIVITK